MPNRIIKESICTSDNIDGLSWFEEVLFYRLIVNCDDYGRFDGRVSIIKNRLFPLKENITAKSIEAAICKLVNVRLVALYMFEGKLYLHLPTWGSHQTVRAQKSRYPAPEDGVRVIDFNGTPMKSSEIICKQMQADAPVIQSNPIQSNPNPIQIDITPCSPQGATEAEVSVDLQTKRFEAFWKAYPKKVGKKAAYAAWRKINPNADMFSRIQDAVANAAKTEQWKRENGRFIPNPTTWLNQGRWDDEPTETTSSGSFDTADFFEAAVQKSYGGGA